MKPKTKLFFKEIIGNIGTLSGMPVPTTHPSWMAKKYNQFEWTRKKGFPWLKATKRK